MSNEPPRRWRWFLTRLIVLIVLIPVPFGLHWLYQSLTALPATVRIATGVEGGRYRAIMDSLGHELAERTSGRIEFHPTAGTSENLRMVVDGEVDFALIQSGVPNPPGLDTDTLRCVGNMYSETVLLLVRPDSGITNAHQLANRTVSLGLQESGDYAAAIDILKHLGLSESGVQPKYLQYSKLVDAFRMGTLDAAIVVVGLDAEILDTLAAEHLVDIIPIPYADAFVTKRFAYRAVELPAATFRTHPLPLPPQSIQTMAVSSQLITREDVSSGLVREITSIVMNQPFQRDARLHELFDEGHQFARHRPSHPLHVGAIQHYEPELKPLLPPDFVEATEGLRSFVVSSLIAIWLFLRWYRDHRAREEEHQLDQYIRQLMEIERRQMDLDQTNVIEDITQLQDLLDEVTSLRQEALAELTAHELNDDRAAGAFIEMCHALTEKINAKLTRQRFDASLQQLAERLSANFPRAPEHNTIPGTPGD